MKEKEEMVILVDEDDNPIGEMEKLQAHEEARLHRAFSVFIFNSKGELLLQQRAFSKYHSPGLWSNTCCSHPRPGETTEDAAHRRMVEELGFDCDFKEILTFQYIAPFDNNLTEHELDHVFIGSSDAMGELNPEEVNAVKYMSLPDIRKEMEKDPEQFSVWFRKIFDEVETYFHIAGA